MMPRFACKGPRVPMADRPTPARPHPPWGRAALVSAGVAILTYLNILPNDYAYDAKPVIEHNDLVTEPGQWLPIWTTDLWHAGRLDTPRRDLLFRPIALSSYRLVRQWAGPAPWPQHLLNLLLHAAVCVLVVWFARRLGLPPPGPLVAGVLFAVLPIHTDAVANLVGRADLLATLGVLGTLAWHDRAQAPGLRPATRAALLAAAMACAFVAMGAKESGVTVVLLLPLWALLRPATASDGPAAPPWRRLVGTAYVLLPLVAYLALRYHALDGQLTQQPPLTKTINVLVDAPPNLRVLGAVQLWGMYWAKTVWPATLCCEYAINAVRLARGVLHPQVLLGLAVTIGLAGWSVAAWRRGQRTPALLTLAVVASYLPTANALVLIQVFFAERIWYLPSVWVVLLGALALRPLYRRPAVRVALGLIVLAAAGRCWLRNADWRDNGQLFASAYAVHPDSVSARYLWGQWLTNHGQLEAGIDLLQQAVEIDLGFTDAHRALGWAYRRAGQLDGALHHFQLAVMHVPDDPQTQTALAEVRAELAGRDAERLQALEATAQAQSGDLAAQLAYLDALVQAAAYPQALAFVVAADGRMQSAAPWHAAVARLHLYAGQRDEAVDRYRRAVTQAPADAALAVELAMLLLERREGEDLSEAGRLLDQAAAAAPGDPRVLVGRAGTGRVSRRPRTRPRPLRPGHRRAAARPPPTRRLGQPRARTLGRVILRPVPRRVAAPTHKKSAISLTFGHCSVILLPNSDRT